MMPAAAGTTEHPGARRILGAVAAVWIVALIAAHGLILILGGAYTYAHVPAGFWVQEWLGLERNPYDRLGHLALVGACTAQWPLARVHDRQLAPLRG